MYIFNMMVRFLMVWMIGGWLTSLGYFYVRLVTICNRTGKKLEEKGYESKMAKALGRMIFEHEFRDNFKNSSLRLASDQLMKDNPALWIVFYIEDMAIWPQRILLLKDRLDDLESCCLRKC